MPEIQGAASWGPSCGEGVLLDRLLPGTVVGLHERAGLAGFATVLGTAEDRTGGRLIYFSDIMAGPEAGRRPTLLPSNNWSRIGFANQVRSVVTRLEPMAEAGGALVCEETRLPASLDGLPPFPQLGHAICKPWPSPAQCTAQGLALMRELKVVSVVDAEDREIGSTTRNDAHSGSLRHRFVQVLVVHPNGRVLLARRSMRKEKGPGLFDASVGGHVDAGEGYAEAMLREAGEELGLPGDGSYEEIGTIEDVTPGVENMVGRLYVHVSAGPFTGWEAEADQIEWFSPEDLASMTTRFPYLFTGGMLSSARLLQAHWGRLEEGRGHQPR